MNLGEHRRSLVVEPIVIDDDTPVEETVPSGDTMTVEAPEPVPA